MKKREIVFLRGVDNPMYSEFQDHSNFGGPDILFLRPLFVRKTKLNLSQQEIRLVQHKCNIFNYGLSSN